MFKILKIFYNFLINKENNFKNIQDTIGFSLEKINNYENKKILQNNYLNDKISENERIFEVQKKDDTELKGEYMNKYLVVLDTTNRPEVVDRGLAGGLKNFYFVFASDPNKAREIVLSTFARHPHIVQQIQYSLKVTNINDILNILGQELPLWSYIPFSRAQRYPGQKATPPEQKINPNNRDEIIPMMPEEIPRPITAPKQNDIDKNLLKETPPVKTQSAQINQNENIADLLTKFMSLIQQNPNILNSLQQQNQQQNQQQMKVYKVENPQSDPELISRMNEVLASSKPRHINAEEDINAFLDEEIKAQKEVEKFKELSPEELEKINKDLQKEILSKD